jgi:hypothetical protein
VVSEALRLRLNGTGDGAVTEDEATDIESGLGWERDGKGGDIDVGPWERGAKSDGTVLSPLAFLRL